MIKELFFEWKLDTWANVLEVIGFAISIIAFIIGILIKSEIQRLKTSYIFDQRIKTHIVNLTKTNSKISQFLTDYDNCFEEIKQELSLCKSELEDLSIKLNYNQRFKCKKLIRFIVRRRDKHFIKRQTFKPTLWNHVIKYFKRLYITTYDDIWIIYETLLEVIRDMENTKLNNKKSLK